MLEDKIQDMKNNIDNPKYSEMLETETSSIRKIDTSIDLNISAFINDEYFSSDLDKINFYREIESISQVEDLDNLIEDFKLINKDFSKEITNLFSILRLKIL
jgi:transcription-repair coupling factor (superfamily II helicase)